MSTVELLKPLDTPVKPVKRNFSIITQNGKMKKTSAKFGVNSWNFSIPAYKTSTGKITCPFADKCIKFCYAQKGFYKMPTVKSSQDKRYELTKQSDFTDIMVSEIRYKNVEFLRVHDSGDYYSPTYLVKWLEIAKRLPKVKFYSYTNSIKMVKDALKAGLVPENFDFIFSDSGKQVNLIDQKKDKFTKIFKTLEDLEKAGFSDASTYDLYATKWVTTNNKIGLVFH